MLEKLLRRVLITVSAAATALAPITQAHVAEPKTEVRAVPAESLEKSSGKPHVNTGVKSLNVKRYTEITAIAGIICLILGICLVKTQKPERLENGGRHNL